MIIELSMLRNSSCNEARAGTTSTAVMIRITIAGIILFVSMVPSFAQVSGQLPGQLSDHLQAQASNECRERMRNWPIANGRTPTEQQLRAFCGCYSYNYTLFVPIAVHAESERARRVTPALQEHLGELIRHCARESGFVSAPQANGGAAPPRAEIATPARCRADVDSQTIINGPCLVYERIASQPNDRQSSINVFDNRPSQRPFFSFIAPPGQNVFSAYWSGSDAPGTLADIDLGLMSKSSEWWWWTCLSNDRARICYRR